MPHIRSSFGVSRLGYFGSFARGEQKVGSDLDVLVQFDRPVGWGFFDLKEYLEKIVGREVDIVTAGGIREGWREAILNETRYIMAERDDLIYVEDMIQGIQKILRYLKTVKGLDEFRENEMVVDAVTRNYEIIGEAAHKISKTIKEAYPEIPWKQMYGLRNFAAHAYHVIEPKILWEIAETHLPKNLEDLERLLQNERGK